MLSFNSLASDLFMFGVYEYMKKSKKQQVKDDFQLLFDFTEKVEKEPVSAEVEKVEEIIIEKNDRKIPQDPDKLSIRDMKRAATAWLLQEKPNCIGLMVPTKISKFQADIAAFWSKPVRKKGKKILFPVKTSIIEVRYNREDCWPDFTKKEELLPLLKQEKSNKKDLEGQIRETEPELRLDDNLFPEYENWEYSQSSNKEYHQCKEVISELEYSLYNGSKFERIRRSEVADFLYLAVPNGAVHPHELADGWGLLYINKDMSVELVREAETWNCPIENKVHLVQNIASSNLKNVMFANGINTDKDGDTYFTKIPKRRRKPIIL